MKATVRRIKGVKGFSSDVWAVYCGGKLLKLFPKKSEANEFADNINND